MVQHKTKYDPVLAEVYDIMMTGTFMYTNISLKGYYLFLNTAVSALEFLLWVN